ncbi:N-acetyl-gamma-glutamyl-phosphate reductase [Lewinella marina]|uniref:N-acetyl-gamma-glutamyl-phosphate reductase n=1 Tax=Neolewinella marina TaxID=438751 RepID=A0A2G0CD14_9BACT|nr:N-acetyl-gamma-glutamyl-phosphate reductase [Neolewinella marina]NJB86959.1 N-acetyl-gamma-glutamyl-phosphate reductase [Neolewinella marina]PHK97845.1 N-acetyl-gamma-glutamyl-phosphate reductase [Neolewinella marina]
MKRVGIIGGGGYTAGELLRILVHHPEVEIAFVESSSQAGKAVHEVHSDLVGDTDLHFVGNAGAMLSGSGAGDQGPVDAVFLCMGHGMSRGWVESHRLRQGLLVVDLSTDYRLDSDWVYGLPEINREATRGATRIANPGCFATAIQLALLPLAAAGLAEGEVHVNGITGSTGAGQSPSPTTHFSWRNANVSLYKAFNHQHLAEISRSAQQVGRQAEGDIHFLPVRGPFARGILVTCYLDTDRSEEELRQLFRDFYAGAAFTHVTDEGINLKQVVNTNKGLVHVEKHGNKVLVTTAIDNLLKGASGQAVQNMNLALGLEEQAGLRLKASMF